MIFIQYILIPEKKNFDVSSYLPFFEKAPANAPA